ncbi:hypothetical protein Tco_0224459, partial [Tanacetum coccineum]
MKALMLSNSQNLQLITSTLLKMKDIHLMYIFILISLYQTNSNDVSFIEPYKCPEPVVLETEVSFDQNGQTDQNDQSVHSNHTNDEKIIDNPPKTKDIQISEHSSSPRVKDTSVQDTIPIPNLPLPIPSVVTSAPQDKWSQDKHMELVNIIG